MRKILLFCFACSLIGGGVWALSLAVRHPSLYGLLRIGFGAVFLMALGGFLLWDDFVRPGLSAKR